MAVVGVWLLATMAKKTTSYLTISQAAKAKGISRAAIYNAIRDKRLPAQKGIFTTERIVRVTQKGWRILKADLAKYQVSDLHVDIGKKTA
jgi:predicted DNA-binding transcriptional regulator AlpA